MKPQLEAYTVREGNQRDFWTRIGSAFQTKNGGYTLVLDAVPAPTKGSYRIVLMPPKADDKPGAGE